MAMLIWKATFIDFEENYHAYVYMRPTFIQHSRVRDLLTSAGKAIIFSTIELNGEPM